MNTKKLGFGLMRLPLMDSADATKVDYDTLCKMADRLWQLASTIMIRRFLIMAEEIGAFEFVAQKKAEGKIRHIGFSFHDKADVLDEFLTRHPEMEYVQLQLNYADWENFDVQSRKCYEVAVKHNKPVLVMEPVKGGLLANVPAEAKRLLKEANPNLSVASWAVRYLASLEKVVMVLSGMSNMEQMEDNLRNLFHKLLFLRRQRLEIRHVRKIILHLLHIAHAAY